MFSRSLEQTLNSAFKKAREKRHEFVTLEHLLLALLDNPEAVKVLMACRVNLDRLRAGLGIFVDETTPHTPLNVEHTIQPTLSFQRVLQRAIHQVQSLGHLEVSGANVLSAIFSESESHAVYFLNQENVTRVDVINYLSQGIIKSTSTHEPRQERDAGFSDLGISEQGVGEESLVELYTENLNQKAYSGRIDPLIGRENELMRTIQILCRRNKNNPLLIGDAGVGKTAIAEGLAQRIVDGRVPKLLVHSTVYLVDLGVLLAGTKYRGDFEKRFKSVLKALSREKNAIIFIDEIHNLVGAGSATGGTMDASNLIKPLLSSGMIRCMGATTYEEYRNFIAKDRALLRRFEKIDIEEPSSEETLTILEGLKPRFEKYHNLQYAHTALKRAVELSSRYWTDRRLPDKAIDVIDEAGAYQQLIEPAKRKNKITAFEIEEIVSKMARIPIQTLSATDKELIQSLPKKLSKSIFGQENAIKAVCAAIKLSRAGLRDPQKPIGSFLLAGPTGVGKTELSKQLANLLGIELIRFDMSEYMEKHAVSRLIGSPPGYVGYEQGGLLIKAINKHPHSILLLDEIEKAHPDLFNILLQVMDYGHLTDNNGSKADFKHVMIMMTTNAGAEKMERGHIGFSNHTHPNDYLTDINRMFSPEFRNRLDAVIPFNYLDTKIILKVVDKFLHELQEQLKAKNIKLSITLDAKRWLAKTGYNDKMGARPMALLIQEKLKLPIASELLNNALEEEITDIRIFVKGNELMVQTKVLHT